MICAEEITRKLRERGIRLTMQRRLVIDTLCEHHDHLLIPDIQSFLHDQGAELNETTIYRILQWLKDLGIVSQTDLGQRGIVYQIIEEEPHHHLVCLVCGKLMDVDNSLFVPLSESLRHDYGFEPRIDHMAIFGTCAECQRKIKSETQTE